VRRASHSVFERSGTGSRKETRQNNKLEPGSDSIRTDKALGFEAIFNEGSRMGHIDPTKEVFAQFRANDRPGPIHMLNLVRLRQQAAYPDGRKATGAEAYAAYGRESGPVFERLGGRIVWQGKFELMLIGPQEEHWDHCFIAEYPSVAAFAEMIRDPIYREAVKHRQAGVEDSRLIRHAVLPVGKTFGEIPK
jgi:uncharacterized protein (DUF1330 family)